MNARKAVERLAAQCQDAGYKVSEAEPFRLNNGMWEILLDIEGHGELFEAYFIKKPTTGNWCWDRGFWHVGTSGDKYAALHEFRDLVLGAARPEAT